MKSYVAIVAALMLSPTVMFAADAKVSINEIAWMGTTASANDEWLELFNPGPSSINLVGWKLQSADGKLKVALKGSIEAGGYYLLERTDNNSVPEITADAIYKGALNNTGGHLILYDGAGSIVDEVNSTAKWPAGNSTTKQTMEKTAKGWQTSLRANGTPKAANSIRTIKPTAPAGTIKTTPPQTTALPKAEKSSNSDSVSVATAAVNSPLNNFTPTKTETNQSDPWILFLAALSVTIISTSSIVALKLFILNKNTNHVRS